MPNAGRLSDRAGAAHSRLQAAREVRDPYRGLVWHGGMQNETKLLASCYRESLSLAAAEQLASFAFPCISTGIFGYPPEQAANVAISAVRDFLSVPSSLREVIFCCYSAGDLEIYQSLLGNTEGG